MLYIFIILLLISLIFHFDYQKHQKGRTECYVILCVVFILIAGLRYRLGIDTIAYAYMYRQFPDLNHYFQFDFESIRFGKGFLFLVALCKSVSTDYNFFQIIHAIFINTTAFYFFYKYSQNIFFSILVYFLICFFPYNFEVLRESCAVSVLLIGWKYFVNHKWIKYYILSFIAYLFHPSGIIMAILPIFYLPIFRPFFTVGKYQIIIACLLFAILGSINIFEIMKLFNVSTLQNYADLYEQSDYAESLNLNIMGIIDVGIRYIIYPVMAVLIDRNNGYKNHNKVTNVNNFAKIEYMVCWYVYIAVLTLAMRIFYRFNNYFAPFLILALSDSVFTIFKNRKKTIRFSFGLWSVILLPYFLFTLSPFFRSDGFSKELFIRRYYPYESIITLEKDKQREELYRSNGR